MTAGLEVSQENVETLFENIPQSVKIRIVGVIKGQMGLSGWWCAMNLVFEKDAGKGRGEIRSEIGKVPGIAADTPRKKVWSIWWMGDDGW